MNVEFLSLQEAFAACYGTVACSRSSFCRGLREWAIQRHGRTTLRAFTVLVLALEAIFLLTLRTGPADTLSEQGLAAVAGVIIAAFIIDVLSYWVQSQNQPRCDRGCDS